MSFFCCHNFFAAAVFADVVAAAVDATNGKGSGNNNKTKASFANVNIYFLFFIPLKTFTIIEI